ncbi:MAG: MATE family efflux transporter [Treponema sp.]|nr:MATE family efflux transporter [Candidatus Treponema equi]
MKLNRTYFNSIFKIALPLILANVISQIQMIIDKAFLGQMNDIYLSAIGNVSSPVWTSLSFCFSVVIGSSIIISQKVGAKDTAEVEKYSASMIVWTNVVPVMLFIFWRFFSQYVYIAMGVSENVLPLCVEYTKYYSFSILLVGLQSSSMVIMQTSNYTKPMMWYGLIRAGLNIFLDWVMIFGNLGCPAMGMKGAAIATVIAEYSGMAYSSFIFFTSKKLFTRPSLAAVKKSSPVPFLKSVKLGINTAFEDFAWNGGNLVLIVILNSINEMAAGIYSMIFGVELLVVVVIGSFGNATLTLSGEAKGACDRDKYCGTTLSAGILSTGVSLVMLLLCVLFPGKIIGLFSKDPELIASCGIYLILMCINLYGKSGNIIIGSAIRGSGNTMWMFFTQIAGSCIVISTALLFVRVFDMGIAGVFVAIITDELIRSMINYLKYRSIAKKI